MPAEPKPPPYTDREYQIALQRLLARIREARGASQAELASESGLHVNVVSRLERGTSEFGYIRIQTLLSLSRYWGTDLAYLLDRVQLQIDHDREAPGLDPGRYHVPLEDSP